LFRCVNPQRKNLPPHSALKLRAFPVMGHGRSLSMWEWPPRPGMQPILIRSLGLLPGAPQQVPIRSDQGRLSFFLTYTLASGPRRIQRH